MHSNGGQEHEYPLSGISGGGCVVLGGCSIASEFDLFVPRSDINLEPKAASFARRTANPRTLLPAPTLRLASDVDFASGRG